MKDSEHPDPWFRALTLHTVPVVRVVALAVACGLHRAPNGAEGESATGVHIGGNVMTSASLPPDADAQRSHENGAPGETRRRRFDGQIAIIGGLFAVMAVLVGALVTSCKDYSDARSDGTNLANQVANLRSQVSERDATAKGRAAELTNATKLVAQYSALVTYALQQGKLSQEEVSRFVTAIATGLPTSAALGQPRTVQITDPAERSQVQDGMMVRGTVAARILGSVTSTTCWTLGCSQGLSGSKRTLWIVTQPASERFFPQGAWPDQTGPVSIIRPASGFHHRCTWAASILGPLTSYMRCW